MNKRLMLSLLVIVATSVSVEAGPIRKRPRPLPHSYIIVLNPDHVRADDDKHSWLPSVSEVAQEMLQIRGRGRLKRLYQKALRGFSAELSEGEAQLLAEDYRVAFVEEDAVVTIDADQGGATWGLDRIDQRDLPLDQTYGYDQTGASVHAYVLDTGLRSTHVEFAGRVGKGLTVIDDGNGTSDCHGHGTHVAGTIGGTTWGVAKNVVIHPVRVLSCSGSGSLSGVIAAIDWVTENHVKPAVANMSLGGGASSALDQAVANSVAAGVTYAVSAGNSAADACNQSPARAAAALTVGATTSNDSQASYSNWGTCVDVYAPGSSIRSAYYSSDTATATMSGTSMAAPHVTGAAALFLETAPTATPAAVALALLDQATANHVIGAGTGSPNLLLYSRFAGGSPVDSTPPTTWITSPASGATLGGTVLVQAMATDASEVTAVEFYVDGSLRCTATSSPYTCSWHTDLFADGAHTLATKAYDLWNNVGDSAPVTVTVDNAPAAPSTIVANGGFESGLDPWVFTGAASRGTADKSANSGAAYAELGGNGAAGSVSQEVSIPSNAQGEYRFWYGVDTRERGKSLGDYLFVEVQAGSTRTTLVTLNNRDRAKHYKEAAFDLSAFRGQTVILSFRVLTDGSNPTTFYIDDVSLK